MNPTTPRPFKIWSNDRQTKKSLVARSLTELHTKGKDKLGYTKKEKVTVHLEDDGTEVEDEDYFETLRDDSVLLLLKEGETYCKPWETGKDETDFVSAASGSDNTNTLLFDMTRKLRHDLATLVTLNATELQCLVDVDTSELCAHLNCSKAETEKLQEACQRYLDEKRDASDAMQAIGLLKEWASSSKASGTDVKRKKTS